MNFEFKKRKLVSLVLFVGLFIFFASPLLLLAQGNVPPPCDKSGKICNPIGNINTVDQFIEIFLKGALRIGIPIIVLAVIYCGFLFVAARGNSEKLTKAKSALLYTLIGAAILLGSWAIAELISSTVKGLS